MACKTYPVESSHATLAAEIVRLRAQNEKLREALGIAADKAEVIEGNTLGMFDNMGLARDILTAARAVLSETEGG